MTLELLWHSSYSLATQRKRNKKCEEGFLFGNKKFCIMKLVLLNLRSLKNSFKVVGEEKLKISTLKTLILFSR